MKLFEKCKLEFNKPKIIHFDLNPTYQSKKIIAFANQNHIQLSTTKYSQHGNKAIEATNNAIKNNILIYLHNKNRRSYKEFRLAWPDHFKHLNKFDRANKKEFRNFVFSSDFFIKKIDIQEVLIGAIDIYNSSKNQPYFKNNKPRKELEILNQNIIVEKSAKAENYTNKSIDIINENNQGYNNYAKILNTVENNKTLSIEQKKYFKDNFIYIQHCKDINVQLRKLYDEADNTLKPVIKTILLTSSQNFDQSNRIINLNTELMTKIDHLQTQNNKSQDIITDLNNYIKKIEVKEKLKAELAEKRKNRQRRNNTQPFLKEHYDSAIHEISNNKDMSFLIAARLRVIITILILTGIRISELRELKVSQILSLLRKGYLAINRQKRGPVNHKAFLSNQGKKILNNIKEDIILLLQYNSIPLPEENLSNYYVLPYDHLYLFSNSKSKGKKPLARPYINNLLNKNLQKLDVFKNADLHFTSHSFRHGYPTMETFFYNL